MQLRRLTRLLLATVLATLTIGQATVVQAATPTQILPDLTMAPPTDFTIFLPGDGRRLLRFTTIAVNIGAGPFQVVGYDVDGATIGDILSVKQQIKRSDGSWIDRPTTARMQWAGDGHNHWHILGYQSFHLQLFGLFSVAQAAKTGFCAFDSYVWTSKKPAFYTWEKTCRTLPNGTVFMGTSRNWGDVYRRDLSFQWVDITGLPLGDYKLRVTADPGPNGGQFKESNETNNEAWTNISIAESKVTVLSKSPAP
jgi:hypothetical protein